MRHINEAPARIDTRDCGIAEVAEITELGDGFSSVNLRIHTKSLGTCLWLCGGSLAVALVPESP